MRENTFTQRARLGAEFLDQHRPGWFNRIDRRLHMWSPCSCVLGQVYGNYFKGRNALCLTQDDVQNYGFWIPPWNFFLFGLLRLAWAWKKEIMSRRSSGFVGVL